jgi:hypothetical protein
VLGFFLIPMSQAEADPLGDRVREERAGDYREPEEPGDGVEIDLEVVGDLVVGGRRPEQPVERDPGRSYRRAGRLLALPGRARPAGPVPRKW